jgi:hypothetical protein
MKALQGRRRYVVWLLAFVMATGTLWLAAQWIRPQRALAARIAAGLDTAPPDALREQLQHLAAFGEEGIPHLVRALKHDRPQIASEARSVLSEELDRWQLLDQKAASRRLALLSEHLAIGIEACSPPTRGLASDLATRILLWPVDAASIDQQQLIAHCERVLVSVRQGEQPTLVPTHIASAISPRNFGQDVSPLDEDLSLPGGGLPVEMTRAPSLPPEERSQPRTLPVEAEVDLQPVTPVLEQPRRFAPDTRQSAGQPPRSETLERIYQLVSSDEDIRNDAEDGLRQAGFDEAQLAVARRFADPSADVRQKLVEQLAGQTVIDARPWLLRLLVDNDARVRLAAARVLATTGDPQLLHQLRQRALEESDAAVRDVLERATRGE